MQILNDLKAKADKGDFGLLDNDYPLAQLKDEYLRHCKQVHKLSTQERYAGCLENILPRMAATRVCQIHPDMVRTYRSERLAALVAPATINLEITVLRAMLRWGASAGERKIDSSPLARFPPLPNDHPKEGRAFSDDEVDRLLTSSPQPWRDIWYCYLVTGLRKRELIDLLFTDIDWDNREIIVRSS
jgi:integrase